MRKLRRLLLRLFGLIFLGILIAVVFNTLTFNSKQTEVEAYNAAAVPPNVVGHLQTAIRIPTISKPDQVDSSVFFQFNNFLQTTFPFVDSLLEHHTINDFSQIYHWKGKDESLEPILLIAHLDVVPVEASSEKDWKQSPFGGILEEGYIWGRGALDDKLNVVGLMESAELLLEQQYRPTRSIYFAFGHDEEVSGKNGAMAIANYFQSKNIHFSYIIDEGSVVVQKALNGLEAPAALIGISEKGYVSLDLKVNLEQGGHSSMPPPSTAIGVLSHALSELDKNPFPAKINGTVGNMLNFLGPEMDLLHKTIFANRWLFGGILENQLAKGTASNALIRTTTAPTIIQAGVKDNVLPSEANATVNFRIIPGETPESVMNAVINLIDDNRVKVSLNDPAFAQAPGKLSPTEGFGFNVLSNTIREIFPESVVAPSLVIAATDARHYEACSDAIYRFMPVSLAKEELGMIHGINEKISVNSYEKLIQFYIRLLQNSTR